MKYHRIVALAENKKTKSKKQKQNKKKQKQKQNKKNKNKKAPSYYGSTENEGRKQNKLVFCWGYISLKAVLWTKNNNPFQSDDLYEYSC